MIEFMIHLQGDGDIPLYEQIYESIRKNISDGKVSQGEKLPSTRFMAKYLQVSRSTVELAYEQLLSEGYIESQPCRGYYVCDIADLYELQEKSLYPKENLEQKEIDSKETKYLDFTADGIDYKHFPFNIWRKIHKNLLLDDRDEILLSGDGQGEYGLRNAIAKYLYQARGVKCEPDDIVIGAGNEYLLILLSQLLGEKKHVLMENPTYLQAYRTFDNIGYQVSCVSVEEEGGIPLEKIRQVAPNLLYLMPSHQFPLGGVMPLKRRLELLKWATEDEERFLIEDDHDSEYRYKGKPIPSLQGIDSHGKVIYLGTFSKSIAPSLRVSYMVLPKDLKKVYEERCAFYSTTVSRLSQDVLRVFLEEGHFGRHLNKMRGIYRNKHDKLVSVLKKYPWVKKIHGDNAGLHLLVEIETTMGENEMVEKAWECGMKLEGLSAYEVMEQKGDRFPTILLGYGNPAEEEIEQGMELLNEILMSQKSE